MFGKKMTEGTARIVTEEGLTGFQSNSTGFGESWQHCKYIVEVTPEGGEMFRAETVAKIPAYRGPNVGDKVNCRYDAASHKVELVLEGDPRFDPKLQKQAASSQRDELLAGGALPPELQALMDGEDGTSSPTPSSQPK